MKGGGKTTTQRRRICQNKTKVGLKDADVDVVDNIDFSQNKTKVGLKDLLGYGDVFL